MHDWALPGIGVVVAVMPLPFGTAATVPFSEALVFGKSRFQAMVLAATGLEAGGPAMGP